METTVDIDTGGTFTDGVVRRGEETHPLKTSTTPHDLTVCFSEIIEQAAEVFDEGLKEFLSQVNCVRYSTTIGTNTVIEKNGADVGLLLLPSLAEELATSSSDGLMGEILREELTREVKSARDERQVSRKYNELAEALSDNVVVAMNSLEQERSTRKILFREQPRHFLGSVPIHLSQELTTDLNDRRRIISTLLDAYLNPKLSDYLYRAEDFLRDHGYKHPLIIFCNDGTSNRVAKTTSLSTYNSGPSAGLEGASALANFYEESNVVTLDIGGTSSDVAVIHDGQVDHDRYGQVEDLETSLPMHKVHSVGGGGSTIARVEEGSLVLGPESAGGNPGPACYGLGGQKPTVTDADLALGILDPDVFAGDLTLDIERARTALREKIAEPLNVTVDEASIMIRHKLKSQVGHFLTETLDEHEIDPEETVLLGYGGAGPTHACSVAQEAGINEVIIPGYPSVFSAYSVGFSHVVHDYRYQFDPSGDQEDLPEQIQNYRKRAERDMTGEGFKLENCTFNWSLASVVSSDEPSAETVNPDEILSQLTEWQDEPGVELKLTVEAPLPTHSFSEQLTESGSAEEIEQTSIPWDREGSPQTTPILDVRELQGKLERVGPVICRDRQTTYVVPPGWSLAVNEHNHMLLRRMS